MEKKIKVGRNYLLEFWNRGAKVKGDIAEILDNGIIFKTQSKTSFIAFEHIKSLYNMDDLLMVDLKKIECI